jgi:hypothetical protein
MELHHTVDVIESRTAHAAIIPMTFDRAMTFDVEAMSLEQLDARRERPSAGGSCRCGSGSS